MSNNYKNLKNWRRKTKEKSVQSLGGKCQICEYNKCIYALEFHHLDQSKKDFTLSSTSQGKQSWNKIKVELEKCILLCANCHREVHYNNLEIPINYQKFNETLIDLNLLTLQEKESSKKCLFCDSPISHYRRVCDRGNCKIANENFIIDISKEDLELKLIEFSTIEIANQLNSSRNHIDFLIKKYNINLIDIRGGKKFPLGFYEKQKLRSPRKDKILPPDLNILRDEIQKHSRNFLSKKYNVSLKTLRKWFSQIQE